MVLLFHFIELELIVEVKQGVDLIERVQVDVGSSGETCRVTLQQAEKVMLRQDFDKFAIVLANVQLIFNQFANFRAERLCDLVFLGDSDDAFGVGNAFTHRVLGRAKYKLCDLCRVNAPTFSVAKDVQEKLDSLL